MKKSSFRQVASMQLFRSALTASPLHAQERYGQGRKGEQAACRIPENGAGETAKAARPCQLGREKHLTVLGYPESGRGNGT